MDEFCIIHGYEHMTCEKVWGAIPHCTECERTAERAAAAARRIAEDAKIDPDDLRQPTAI